MRACRRRAYSAGELAQLVDLAPASVSEHLKVLRKTGILTLDVRHRHRFYRTDKAALEQTARGVGEL